LERNPEPPINYANAQNNLQSKMNKTRNGKLNPSRFDKNKNQVLYYYRSTVYNKMINNEDLDFSNEPDLDAICV